MSCPDLDDIIHDSSDGEENSSPITRGSFLEDMVVLNHRDTKRCSKEYESHTLHDLLREDFRMEFNEAVKEQIKSGLTRKSLKGNDEYNLLKSPSVDLNNLTKARTNSILKMLEHNHDIRRKMTGIEQA